MKKTQFLTLFILLMILISGCSNSFNNLLVPKEQVVNPNLPSVNSIRAIASTSQIALEWTPYYEDIIQGYYIYRSNSVDKTNKMQLIAKIDNRYVSHYVDTKLSPETTYIYNIRTYTQNDQVSNFTSPISVKTKGLIESVPFSQAIMGLPGMIKLIWRPHPDEKVVSYVIQRTNANDLKWKTIAEVDGRLNAEYIDKDLKPNMTYKYRIFVKTTDGTLSKPTEILEATTKPLPEIVQNVKASQDLPKKIVLTWDKLNRDDISYYKVYSAPNSFMFYTYKAKTKSNFFEDLINKNGDEVYYKVTAVDNYGLESKKQENPIIGKTLSAPKIPVFTQVFHSAGEVYLRWQDVDNRAVKYQIEKSGEGQNTIFKDILGTEFKDTDVKIGVEYSYKISAIDKYGLKSEESKKVIVVIK